ncbi:MAG: SGNH/GDSL hydrolase family protein [Patescibacteria group bacterium]
MSYKKLAINLLVSVASIIIVLGLAEGVVKFFSGSWFNQHFHESRLVLVFGNCRTTDFRTSQSSLFFRLVSFPPDLLYENRPDASGTLFGTRVKINSYGMRDNEVAVKKPAGVYRIAVLGDSVVFGYEANQQDLFTEVLEKRIAEKMADKVEVLNFGVPGYSTKQELVQLESKVLQFDPDMVIIAQHPNDIYGTGVTSLTPSFFLKLIAEHSNLFGCFNRNGKLISSKGVGGSTKPTGSHKELYAKDSEVWKNYEELFDNFGKISKENNIPIIVATLPEFKNLNEKYEYGYIHDMVAERAKKAGLSVISMHPPLVIYEEGAVMYRAISGDIDHPNEKGHAKIADMIYNELIRQDLLPIK